MPKGYVILTEAIKDADAMIEFDSVDVPLRQAAAECNVAIISGFEMPGG